MKYCSVYNKYLKRMGHFLKFIKKKLPFVSSHHLSLHDVFWRKGGTIWTVQWLGFQHLPTNHLKIKYSPTHFSIPSNTSQQCEKTPLKLNFNAEFNIS